MQTAETNFFLQIRGPGKKHLFISSDKCTAGFSTERTYGINSGPLTRLTGPITKLHAHIKQYSYLKCSYKNHLFANVEVRQELRRELLAAEHTYTLKPDL